MPYIRPIQLLRLQKLASDSLKAGHRVRFGSAKDARSDLKLCPVCGEDDCGQAVVMINDYLFHEADVEQAEEVGVEMP